MGKMQRRIIVRAPNWVGDAVLCTPALAVLRKKNPSSFITVLAQRRVSDCFLHNPCVDKIIPLSDRKDLSYWMEALELRRMKYDLGILFPNSFSSAFFFRISGLRKLSGYRRDGRGFLLTDALGLSEELCRTHQVKYYFHIIDDHREPPELVWVVSEEEKKEARAFLEKEGISPKDLLFGISPGGTFGPAKRWPPECFASLADGLIKRYSARILLFGNSEEKEIADIICGRMHGKPVNLAGVTSLRQLGALLNICRVLISNDSGTMHVAAAVKTPLVAIFGSTDPSRTGPWGSGHRVIYSEVDCSPCFARRCPRGDYKCLQEIQVEDVFRAVEGQLKDGS